MAGMSRNNSTSSLQGFSVFQPALGSTLQWLPALGSLELDEMVHTFLPGPASIQDKRAHISMDFFEFARQTGETFKFYPVYNASFTSTSASTASPASSSAMHDSGYGSSFNASPVVSSMSPWTPSLPASTPASAVSNRRTQSRSGPNQGTASAGLRKQLDFSNHPGMRILTKDGRDITNSASRGCKSKEQRDHAHLMRIIKACEACRRKKIRCDPSHKKRSSSQPQPTRPDAKLAKKAKVAALESPRESLNHTTTNLPDFVPSFETDTAPADALDGINQNTDDFWHQFVHFDGQAVSFAGEHDFGLDSSGYVTFSNASSSVSPAQSFLLPTPPVPTYHGLPSELASQEPALPYLNPGDSYGNNYQDFNLYSPTSELEGLDEEWQSVTKPRRSTHAGTQYNLPEPSFSRATPAPPNIDLSAALACGQNHQHGEALDVDLSDWPPVYATDAINVVHETIATNTHSNIRTPLTSRQRAPLPHSHSSPDGPDGMPPLDAATETATAARSARNTIPQTFSSQQDSAGALAHGRLSGSPSLDVYGTLRPESHINCDAATTPPAGLARASRSRSPQTAGHPSPTSQPAEEVGRGSFAPAVQKATSSSLRRGLFSRSAFVLEPNDYSDVVVLDQAHPSSVSGPVSHGSSGDHIASHAGHREAKSATPGLREAPQAHHVMPASGSSVPSTEVASSPWPAPQGVPGAPVEGCHPPFPGTAGPALNVSVTLGAVFCLFILLMRWACPGRQLELLFALCLSASSFACPKDKRTMDSVRSAAAETTRLLPHSLVGRMVAPLLSS